MPDTHSVDAMHVREPVEYLGNDDVDLRVYRGHPGRVVDADRLPHEVSVAFVNGPSLCFAPHDLRSITEADYLVRGRRLVGLTHPLEDRPVPRFNAEGQEWPDGHEPTP